MAEIYDVIVEVVSQNGHCALGHKVGDQWTIGQMTPAGIYYSAYNAIHPNVQILMFGGVFPWARDPDTTRVACPDGQNPVIFELRRVKQD
jgi:uncharacterized repeat protein (TIGR04076 family)